MKILVTGGAGFIGSHITDAYIDQGHEVHIVDNFSTGRKENVNPKATLHELDLNDEKVRDICEKEKFDIINHQAAQIDVRTSVSDPRYDANINILGSINLYEAAKQAGTKKIIFASSGGAIYGEQDYFPADEEHPTNPCSPYGIGKLVNEKYLYYYNVEFGIEYVSLRYANVYGPRQNHRGEAGVVAIFLHKMLTGEQPVINGDGKNTRDYTYVGDVVQSNLFALEEKCSGIYNVGTAVENDVNLIFRNLKEMSGSDCEEIHGEAKEGEQRRSVIVSKRLKEQFGWQPKVELKNGLSRTADFFKEKLKG